MTDSDSFQALPGLTTRMLGRHWLHLPTVDSTNNYCRERADTLPDGCAVTARVQTGGKGRLGRGWNDQPDCGLALSILLRGGNPEQAAYLPLLAGLAVCEGVEALCGARCALKWSNDVLIGGKKLCGILCESRVAARESHVVVGIGVNLVHSQEDFARLGLVYATSLLLDTGNTYTVPQVTAAILNHMEPLLETCAGKGFAPLLERYRQRCVTLGKPVRVLWQGEERTGTALDIAPDGALLCDLDGETCAVRAGEASVRGLYGYV